MDDSVIEIEPLRALFRRDVHGRFEGSAMKLLGRRWMFAAEDLAIPSACESLPNALIMIGLLLFVLQSFDQEKTSLGVRAYSTFSLILHGLLLIVNLSMLYSSCATTIFQPNPSVERMLKLRIGLAFLQLISAVFGSLVVFHYWNTEIREDSGVGLVAFQGTVALNWIEILLFSCFLCIFFNRFGGRSFDSRPVEEEECGSMLAHLLCQYKYCGCRVEVDDEDFLRIAREALKMFKDLKGFVLSDALAALALVNAFQRIHKTNAIEGTGPYYRESPPDYKDDEKAVYFRNFMMGAYGATLRAITSPHLLCCLCIPYSKELGYLRSNPELVHENDCCKCSLYSFQKRTNIPSDCIYWASLSSSFGSVVFYCCKDQTTQSLVLALRGTFSMPDVFTDLDASVVKVKFSYRQNCNTQYCHKGMYTAANSVFGKLKESGIVRTFFRNHPEYKFVIVGHSLGAAVAALLTFMFMDEFGDDVYVECFAYGSPPVLDPKTAASDIAKERILSIVHSDDVFARMSIASLTLLKRQMIFLLEEYVSFCQSDETAPYESKWRIFSLIPRASADQEEYMKKFLCCSRTTEGMSELMQKVEKENEHPMHIAGRIMYIREPCLAPCRGVCYCCPSGYSDLVMADPSQFKSIKVSAKMLTDHFPQNYNSSLERLQFIQEEP